MFVGEKKMKQKVTKTTKVYSVRLWRKEKHLLPSVFICGKYLLLFLLGGMAYAQEPAVDPVLQPSEIVETRNADLPSDESAIRSAPKRLVDYDLPGMTNPVNLNTTEPWDIVQLIEFLAHEGDIKNIVIAPGVQGSTKIRFENARVGDAIEVVLSVNKLAYTVKNGIITIMSDAEYTALYGTSFYDNKDVALVELKYADPAHIAKLMENLKSGIGTVIGDPATGTVLIIDTPEKISEMKVVIEKTDKQKVTKAFVLQYAEVETVQEQLAALITAGPGNIRVDKRTKTIIVTALPPDMDRIEHMIKTFDKVQKQVFIEAKVVEVVLSDSFSLGINWQGVFQNLDPRYAAEMVSKTTLVGTPGGLLGGETATGGTLTYNTIAAGGDLNVILNAMKNVGETRILSNPQIAVVDGQEASIKVVEDQPYKEIALESGTTNEVGITYLFKEVGVTLSVTPKINDEEYISVDIKPEISTISQWYDGDPQEGTPVIKKSTAQTSVIVKNGVTIIIGGLITDRKDTNETSVPFLGKIPLIGRLFRSESVVVRNTETVVFMTPRIVTGDEAFLRSKDIKKPPKPLRPVDVDEEKKLKPMR